MYKIKNKQINIMLEEEKSKKMFGIAFSFAEEYTQMDRIIDTLSVIPDVVKEEMEKEKLPLDMKFKIKEVYFTEVNEN